MSFFFSRYCTMFFDFLENWTWGYVLGPKILFSSMLVLCALITTCFEKNVFLGTPPAIYHIFGDVVFLYPSEAPICRHSQMPKNRRIFFARPAIIFIYPSGINLWFPIFCLLLKNQKRDDATHTQTHTNDTHSDNKAPWRRNYIPKM